MANIFRKSGILFLCIVLGIILFSSATNAIPLRKNNSKSKHNLPEFIKITPSSESKKKKRENNPNAQSTTRIGITPEQEKSSLCI